ncbi:MAG: phosphoenolpyruvate carboxykinase (GTP) [bacterium]
MKEKLLDLLKAKCGKKHYQRLLDLNNPGLIDFVAKYVEHCNPDSVFVRTDSAEDARYIRDVAVELKEEKKLAIEGHTVHFDGFHDQARDKANTKYLLSPGTDLGQLNAVEKEKGFEEIHEILKNIMQGKEMFVCIFCLGPTNSEFAVPSIQLTDSSYVAHSEGILYRSGYEEFKKQSPEKFFKVVHSAGSLENGVSKEVGKRRIYIDLEDYTVYSTNTQYAGNTVGFKKLSLRMAIYKASHEGWLAEHMLVMGVLGTDDRITYFTGAFPSMCGKTSTAMVTGEKIVGDDIAYLRVVDGKLFSVNVECGIFGIIQDVNSEGDPLIWETLNSPGEIIFSNILVTEDGIPYWRGDGREIPERGINYSGDWFKGKKNSDGSSITHSHKNARYTVGLHALKNCDPNLDNPEGVRIKGIIYGGRDSDTSPPVLESFDWKHGVITMGAALESETTAATLGKEGVRVFQPMSNIDFVSIPLGKYINNHLDFGRVMDNPPVIFSVNYFLKDKDGKYMNAIEDKRVWLKWMELRVHNNADAGKTSLGYIPKYEDLKILFKEVLDKEYAEEDYRRQFTLRIPENIRKIERIIEIYRTKVSDAPDILFTVLEEQKQRLEKN